jgi:hypothetical protein
MTRGEKIFAILGGVALAAVVGYYFAYPTLSYRVRLTIEVDQRGERKVGSSVVEISEVHFPTFWGLMNNGVEFHARGEAAFLDLGEGNNLIALLGLGGGSDDDIVTISLRTFVDDAYLKNPDYGKLGFAYRTLAALTGKPRELGPKFTPTLARFRDLTDPKTIEAVDPANLAASYGPGVSFLRATLEITYNSVTSGVIEKRLPWLHAMIGDSPNDPAKLPIYHGNRPELGQDRIFFTGFVRR